MYEDARAWLYRLFAPGRGGRAGYYTDWFIQVLIAANVVAVMLQTVPALSVRYHAAFRLFEIASVAVFTVEYLARVWSIVEDPDYDGPVSGRLRYASRPLLVVDLLAILPFYLAAFGIAAELRFLRALRLIRLLRLLKLARYSRAMATFSEVIERKRPDLLVALFINGLLLIVSSSVMYYVERDAQPDVFTSIPETLWWGVVTLTTVGYGDVVPVTPLGQFFGAITAVLGVGLFALPASILAAGFLEVHREETYECPHCSEEISYDELSR